jgi:hypothetical protein
MRPPTGAAHDAIRLGGATRKVTAMDSLQLDTLTRAFASAGSRRSLLGLAVAAVLGRLGRSDGAGQARSKGRSRRFGWRHERDRTLANRHTKHKRKHRATRPPTLTTPPPLPSCAETCSNDCQFCLTLADGPLLCAERVQPNCDRSCTSDTDCLDPTTPTADAYCVISIEFRQTGEVVPPQCPTGGGKCSRATACVP